MLQRLKVLLCHIQQALDNIYIDPFVDNDTNILSADILVIDEHLFKHHGQVCGEEVNLKETEIPLTPFTPSDPLVIIWNPTEKLVKCAAQANLPYREHQKLILLCNSSKIHVILNKD